MTTLHAPALEPVMAGLWATAPHELPFSSSLEIRAYVLERDEGDVLVYHAPGAAAAPQVSQQLLVHWHEAAFGGEALDVPLAIHAAEVPHLPDGWAPARTFTAPTTLGGDLLAIPIPGHTAGSTAYLWDSGRRRFLFTGDSVLLRGDRWVGAMLPSSDRRAYVESLGVLAGIEFDVLVPWAATRDHAPVAPLDPADARRRLEAIRQRIWNGEDG